MNYSGSVNTLEIENIRMTRIALFFIQVFQVEISSRFPLNPKNHEEN